MESILNIQEKYHLDDSIKSYEYYEYYPANGPSNLNMAGQITITIDNQDEWYHPRRNVLLVEGDLMKANDTRYGDDDLVSLANNGIMYLFSNVKYVLGDHEIESVNHPGFASTMLGMLKHPADNAKGSGLLECWYPDTTVTAAVDNNNGFAARHNLIIKKPTPKGSFSFMIEFEKMFGFCEDFDEVVYGVRHSLKLIRQNDDDAIFRSNAAAAGKVKLSKISWLMPRVHASDEKKIYLVKTIASKAVLDVAY